MAVVAQPILAMVFPDVPNVTFAQRLSVCLKLGTFKENVNQQNGWKKWVWAAVTACLTLIIMLLAECVTMWYLPLSYVNSPNTLEDYYLWWFSLCMAAFFLPPWFFSARHTIRLFLNNQKWLAISAAISPLITVLTVLAAAGVFVWEFIEYRSWREQAVISDIPEYAEAAAMGSLFQAAILGMALFYLLCLLFKQRRAKHQQ